MPTDPLPESNLDEKIAEAGREKKTRCPAGHETGTYRLAVDNPWGVARYWCCICGRRWVEGEV